ncbi:MAG: glycoside hydrolase family 127 protein [Lachnospiraceae bacterium]|nr:glycoside hydrolase family 127 protein [Lachnospiraceae bacterium]
MRKEKLQTIPLTQIRIDDSFWNRYTSLVTKKIIPYQWSVLNDEAEGAEASSCMKNFRVAAGLEKGTFHGYVFQDTDLAKWLEAAAYSLSYEKDKELEKLADAAIDLIERAQEENGYLDTYFTISEPGKQFKNLKEGHELYTAGHFIEAAVAYYKVTGKDRFLKIMRRTADLICEVFHTPRYENAVPGHEEIELALMKLYEVTGEESYRQMAYDFVNRRGTEPNYLYHESEREDFVDVWHDSNPYLNAYGQNHLPVREQKTAEGHAVRAVYLYCAMADLAYACQDEALFEACSYLYRNIIEKRMYITGGIGSSGTLERFTTDYDLPNDTGYCESCASIGLALFCRRMAQITGDSSYADTMELALINTVTAGIAMDGRSFFYVNPLEVWPDSCIPSTDKNHVKAVRQKWFGCACCPPNIARTLASLGEYACFTGKTSVWLNLLTGGKIETELGGTGLTLTIDSRLPYEGRALVKLESEGARGELRLRIPAYAENPVFLLDGEKITPTVEKGYAVLSGVWKKQTVELSFSMEAHFVYANPKVRADAGKAAVMKGPLVYCLEEADNGENLSALYVDVNAPLGEEYREDLLGGTVVIHARGKRISEEGWENLLYGTRKPKLEETELIFVPYHSWGNRKQGEMSTWVKIF